MTIRAEIQFNKEVDGRQQEWLVALEQISIPEIEAEIVNGADALIINTFVGKVPLEEMIESTSESTRIMSNVSKPVDILAVMERGSSLAMSIADIKKTAEIMDFASHPKRGATIAVMYEKSISKFFLTIANQLLPNANFIIANNLDDAYIVLKKFRSIRV